MAQSLAVKRFLTLPGRCLRSRVQTFSGISGRWTPRLASLSAPPPAARHISTSPVCRVTFNVQNKEDFQQRVLESDVPVVVDFHAQWCGPCKLLAPRLEKAVARLQGKVCMAKVDIDENTDLALEYEVSAVPTVLAMRKGAVVDQFMGVKDEDQVEAFLNRLIGPQ